MTKVPVRELNQDTAGVLARVKRGEEIDVTERGVVIARLVPARTPPLGDLIAAGVLHPPASHDPLPRPTGPVRTDSEAGQTLREMRDDERF